MFPVSNFKKKGFTLIEILLVIGILVILTAIFVFTFRFFQKESDLTNTTEEVIDTLRLSRNKTLASQEASRYGVYFNSTLSPNQYTLFKGENYVSRDVSFDEIHKIPKLIEIFEIDLEEARNEVVFERLTGLASQSGYLSLRLKADPTKTKTIYIDDSGQIGTSPLLVPTNSRIKDSRHVHFDLGWSIQNATTLKFDFINAGPIETVAMADYFNLDKTEFDWSGTFTISGVDQVFRIHTHSLDAFNTILCIHRDRNQEKTDQEVIIYIVDGGLDKDIAHYLADPDDTVNVGSFGGTKEVQ